MVTEVGHGGELQSVLMLHVLASVVVQLRFTVPVNPSTATMYIAPTAVFPPAFTLGKLLTRLKVKFGITVAVNVAFPGAVPMAVEARMVTA